MKKCIWCLSCEDDATFEKVAHTIPQSLGGKQVCVNVCDDCNSYFGNHQNKFPPVETILKEAFNISRYRFLQGSKQIGKNKAFPRFKSTYFNINFEKNSITTKPQYKLQQGFQRTIGRLLTRGVYMLYLEELERQNGLGLQNNFQHIREFARYDNNELPLFYFNRKYGLIFSANEWLIDPQLQLEHKMKYLLTRDDYEEIEFFGHVFGVVKDVSFFDKKEEILKKSLKMKVDFFTHVIIVRYFGEIDLTLKILN